jgi:hypothetical protein
MPGRRGDQPIEQARGFDLIAPAKCLDHALDVSAARIGSNSVSQQLRALQRLVVRIDRGRVWLSYRWPSRHAPLRLGQDDPGPSKWLPSGVRTIQLGACPSGAIARPISCTHPKNARAAAMNLSGDSSPTSSNVRSLGIWSALTISSSIARNHNSGISAAVSPLASFGRAFAWPSSCEPMTLFATGH